MSSTRYMADEADRETAPERYLASASIAGINVGLNVIGRVARNRTDEERRAMVWVHNYARILQITADSLSEQLGLTRAEINEALTNPACPHMARFVERQQALRRAFEASLPQLVSTRVTRVVRNGILEAAEDRVLSQIIGPERVGKSEAFQDEFHRRWMDCGILINCPQSRDMRAFTSRIAQALGINVNNSKKNEVIVEQIASTLSTGILRVVCIDEGQNLWPKDIGKQRPERLEFLRDLWDVGEINRRARRGLDGGGGIGFAICATPQFASDMNEAIHVSGRWKPGQLEGRMRRSHTPDTLSRAEVTRIARFHAPEFPDSAIETLVDVTLASTGLLGFLVNVIGKIRFELRRKPRTVLDGAFVNTAARKMLRGTLIEQQAAEARRKKGLPPLPPPDEPEEDEA
jgi:hypothetical protein